MVHQPLSVCQQNVEEINVKCNRHVSPVVHISFNSSYTVHTELFTLDESVDYGHVD
jgi:hypothetical protein